MSARPIPEGYGTVTPSLVLEDARAGLDFYAKALGAEERACMTTPDGKVAHAEMQIGDTIVMLADEWPDWGVLSPKTLGGAGVSLFVYVVDSDALFRRAVEAGAEVVQPMTDQFWGDRTGTIDDPFGHRWTIATHVEDVVPEEMERRFREWMAEQGG